MQLIDSKTGSVIEIIYNPHVSVAMMALAFAIVILLLCSVFLSTEKPKDKK